MKNVQTRNTEGRMFENPIMEALSKSSPVLHVITYGSIIGILLFIHSIYGVSLTIWQAIGLYLVGLLFWTFAEYILHRYLFHWITESPLVQQFHYSVHGYHHEFPRDEKRVFMPPVPGILMSSILLGIFSIFLGSYVYIFTAGFINGYLLYSSVHYSTHRFKPPKSKFLKTLWRHHNLHHYRFPDKAFGVSSPLWDYVFGTMPPMPNRKRKNDKTANA